MKATLKARKIVAEGTLMATFQLAEPPAQFVPGQFINLELINPPYHDEKGSQRYFSIVNTPNDQGEISIATRLRDSAFKKSLAEIPLDSPVEINAISGNFNLPQDSSQPIAFITGGIGITPFMSMARYATENNLSHQITLMYFNRNQASTAFLPELQELAQKNPNFNLILIMTEDNDWHGETRQVDVSLIKEYLPKWQESKYMIAGPAQMVESVSKVLTDMAIARENIITENFAGY